MIGRSFWHLRDPCHVLGQDAVERGEVEGGADVVEGQAGGDR